MSRAVTEYTILSVGTCSIGKIFRGDGPTLHSRNGIRSHETVEEGARAHWIGDIRKFDQGLTDKQPPPFSTFSLIFAFLSLVFRRGELGKLPHPRKMQGHIRC